MGKRGKEKENTREEPSVSAHTQNTLPTKEKPHYRVIPDSQTPLYKPRGKSAMKSLKPKPYTICSVCAVKSQS